MLTYQVRKRVLRVAQPAQFPCDVVVNFHLLPPQPFGTAVGGGLTTVRAQPASVFFNANSGQHTVESKNPLGPLEVRIEEPARLVTLEGTRLTVHESCEDLNAVTELIDSLYFGLPLLLAIQFGDPPYVERVDGTLGSVPFRWELADWKAQLDVTTQENQEERFGAAWKRFDLISAPKRRRLLGALHYFHVACRLKREAKVAGEFLAEALLNFHKVLEILYGPQRDLVCPALENNGYSKEEIERDFIPSMLLRNSIDIGHPMLSLFTLSQLETLHRYADRAEWAFRGFLRRIFEGIESGSFDVPSYEVAGVDAETATTIERLRKSLDALGDQP